MVLLPSSMIVMTDRHFRIGLKYTFPYPTFERKSFADDMEHFNISKILLFDIQ